MLSIKDLKEKKLILFECISGSHAYGLATEKSDCDIRGVFYLPKNKFYGLTYQAQVSDSSNDVVYYELGRFIELLLKSNPSCLELLATPEKSIRYKSPLFDHLSIDDFLSKSIKDGFMGYALSQIKKAKGLKKKIVNPIALERKTILDFCYIISDDKSIRLSLWLIQNNINPQHCGLSKLTHSTEVFALYLSNDTVNYRHGLIKDNTSSQLRLCAIPKGEKPIAHVLYQQDAYSTYCKEYASYWEWIKNRNSERYFHHNETEQDYDSKNMMHTIRLLKMAKELFETGKINVFREDRAQLLAIKSGKYTFHELIELTDELKENLVNAYEKSDLPETLDSFKIEQQLIQIRNKLYH